LLTISAEVLAELEFLDFVPSDFGNVLYSVLSSVLDVVPFPEPQTVREHIRQGRWGFLFDGEGRFQEKC
jgi:hypothetical protein